MAYDAKLGWGANTNFPLCRNRYDLLQNISEDATTPGKERNKSRATSTDTTEALREEISAIHQQLQVTSNNLETIRKDACDAINAFRMANDTGTEGKTDGKAAQEVDRFDRLEKMLENGFSNSNVQITNLTQKVDGLTVRVDQIEATRGEKPKPAAPASAGPARAPPWPTTPPLAPLLPRPLCPALWWPP